MKELFLIGVAILVGIATFTIIRKRTGENCLP
jgi:hypothetical protein